MLDLTRFVPFLETPTAAIQVYYPFQTYLLRFIFLPVFCSQFLILKGLSRLQETFDDSSEIAASQIFSPFQKINRQAKIIGA
jgi:hypothetical protein